PDGEIVEETVVDKRLCIIETEFSTVLRRMERQDNTLSAVLRDAWDGKDLQTLTKNSPLMASEPHISLIAHSTADELRRYLGRTEQVNGFINRFALVCVTRSKELPDGGHLSDALLDGFVNEVARVAKTILDLGEFEIWRDQSASELWRSVYH